MFCNKQIPVEQHIHKKNVKVHFLNNFLKNIFTKYNGHFYFYEPKTNLCFATNKYQLNNISTRKMSKFTFWINVWKISLLNITVINRHKWIKRPETLSTKRFSNKLMIVLWKKFDRSVVTHKLLKKQIIEPCLFINASSMLDIFLRNAVVSGKSPETRYIKACRRIG